MESCRAIMHYDNTASANSQLIFACDKAPELSNIWIDVPRATLAIHLRKAAQLKQCTIICKSLRTIDSLLVCVLCDLL